MDFQHRAGGKTGSGGVASASESNRDRRERLRQLALETIDINKDPYFMKNHLGSYECKLCLTLHNNEVRKSVTRNYMKWFELEHFSSCKIYSSAFTGQLPGSHTGKETSDQFVSHLKLCKQTAFCCSLLCFWFCFSLIVVCLWFLLCTKMI